MKAEESRVDNKLMIFFLMYYTQNFKFGYNYSFNYIHLVKDVYQTNTYQHDKTIVMPSLSEIKEKSCFQNLMISLTSYTVGEFQ